MSEVREGYKMTELGELPADWEVFLLEQLADISTGNKDTKDKLKDGKYPFYVRSNIVEKIDSYSFDGEAVLTAGDGVGVGKVFHYVKGKFDFHQRVYKISDFKNLDGKYFYYYFSDNFYKQVQKFNAKTSVDSVRREMITKLLIPLPILSEQQKIAEILSTVDTQIEQTEQLIEKTKELKKGLMQQLLTKGIGHTTFKQSIFGEIPSTWDVFKFEDLTLEHKQGYYTKDVYTEEGVKLARITDLGNPKVDYSNMPMLQVSDKDYEAFKVNENDFLFARSGAIGRYGIVKDLKDKVVFASYLIRFKFDLNKVLNEFLGYFYESSFSEQQIKKITQGSSNININANNIKALNIVIPPLKEQEKIVRILSTVDVEINNYEQEKAKYEELKKGLMQQLLTGKMRVKVD